MITESVELVSDMTAARPFSWRCTVCGEQGKSYLRNSANHTQARRHRCAAATVHSEGGSHYARCEHSSHAPWGWTGFSFTSQGAAETQLTEHLAMHPAVELARTSGQVAVVGALINDALGKPRSAPRGL
jgi:hypothetical protein